MNLKTLMLIGAGGTALVTSIYCARSLLRQYVVHLLLEREGDGLRREVQARLVLPDYHSPSGHSHGMAAEARTRAAMAMKNFVRGSGYVPYVVSKSSRDADDDGYHGYYMSKDVQFEMQRDKIRDEHVLMFVDVDYYCDMFEWCAFGRPILLYTFVPECVGGQVDDASFVINNDEINMVVNGGGSYQHKLWAYDSDWLKVNYWWGTRVFSCEQKQVDPHHRIILLNPIATIWTPLGRWLLPGLSLERRVFGVGKGVNRLDYLKPGGVKWTSVGTVGSSCSVNMSTRMFEALAIRFAASTKPDIHTIERYLVASAVTDKEKVQAAYDAPLLYSIYKIGVGINPQLMCAVGKTAYQPERMRTYQCVGYPQDGFSLSEEGRSFGRCVAAPLTDDIAVVPVDSLNNDLQCVNGRVEAPRNLTWPTFIYENYAAEFVDLLVRNRGCGVPWSLDMVNDVQNRPTQRARTDRVWSWISPKILPVKVKAFMKKEAYSAVNDPRNISQVETEQTLRLSAMTYAFKVDVLRSQDWYVPGKTPSEIASRMFDYAQSYNHLGSMDYSRFDGSISEFLAMRVVRPAYLAWAGNQYKNEVGRLLAAEYNAKGVTKFGVKYDAGYGTLSGSPRTTDGNTMINAYICYCTWRQVGENPQKSYQRIGLCAGDDGINATPPEVVERVSRDLGLKVKLEVSRRGAAVKFLSRIFVDPWGSMGSFQDPDRTIKKLHISFAPSEVTDEEAVYNRAEGYLTLDPEAPIVSNWCRKVLQTLGPVVGERAHKVLTRCDKDVPYYKVAWPQVTDVEFAIQRYAESLGIGSEQVRAINRLIDGALDYRHLRPMLITSRNDKLVNVADGRQAPLKISRAPRKKLTQPRVYPHDSGLASPTDSSATGSRGSTARRRHRHRY